MAYDERDLLPISALQHFLYCPRQCALIHIERVWEENLYTVQGRLVHERVHSQGAELRSGGRVERGLPIRSFELGLTGRVDLLQWSVSGDQASIVEYKRGSRKIAGQFDEVQVCAQALCLEEMVPGVRVSAFIYHAQTRRRERIILSETLRSTTRETALAVHDLVDRGVTPPPVYRRAKCSRCSLASSCLPKGVNERKSVAAYLSCALGAEENVSEADT